jgi:hypothetical protein
LKLRLLVCAAFVGLTALSAASVAAADTQWGIQDPTVTVSASLLSRGSDPNVARPGDVVDASVTMDSNVDTTTIVRVFVFGDFEGTRFSFEKSKIRKLRADGSWDWSGHITVKEGTPPGVYHLSIVAITPGVIDSSAATASITVTN